MDCPSYSGKWDLHAKMAGKDCSLTGSLSADYLAFLRGHSGVWGREDAGLDRGDTLTPLLFHSWNAEKYQQ